MANSREELRAQVALMPRNTDGKRKFSGELKGAILEYSKAQQAMGRSQFSIAEDVGLKGWTLNRWHQNERKLVAPFVEVTTKKRGLPGRRALPEEAIEAFEVTCPNGFEVRVPSRFSGRELRELLAALEGR